MDTFSNAVSTGMRLYAWKMNPVVFRRNTASSFLVMTAVSFPETETVPAVGTSRQPTRCKKVVFPLPEGPATAANSPGEKDRLMPRSA